MRCAHRPAGAEGHFGILDMEARVGKQAEAAGMIVMQVGEDHVLDRDRIDTGVAQPLDRPGG